MKTWWRDLALITLICGLFFGLTLGHYPLAAPDGARYAEIPREMLVTGDYLTPRLNGLKYFEKPPLFYWMQAGAMRIFGVNDLAASLMNALMTLGTIFLIYLLGRKIYNRRAGLFATLIYSSTILVFALTRVITLDVTLTFFLTAFLTFFLLATQQQGKSRTILFYFSYIATAGAVMTKGLIGALFPALLIVGWLTLSRDWKNLRSYAPFGGFIIFLLLVIPWHWLMQLKNPEFFHFYFTEQHFLRYCTTYADRTQKWWFLPLLTLAGFYPATPFLIAAFTASLRKMFAIKQRKIKVALLLWINIIYLFYTFSQSKLIPYILPIFPIFAIFTGAYFEENLAQLSPSRHFRLANISVAFFNVLLGSTALIATFCLDFQQQTFTKTQLIVIAVILLSSGLLTYLLQRCKAFKLSILISICGAASCWFYFSPQITTVNRQAIKPLAITLKQRVKPQDLVICYGDYYQDLPFYLNRLVKISNFRGELAFGMLQEPENPVLMNQQQLATAWSSAQRCYVLLEDSNLSQFTTALNQSRFYVLAKLRRNLLITNQDPKIYEN